MDFKKSAFPENRNHCSTHQRRRVVYGFGIGLLASLIAFFAIFLTISSKVTLLNPVLHGFNNLGSFNNTPNLFSWSFSFSSTSCLSPHCSLHIGSVNNDSSKKVDHMILREKGTGNLSKNGGISNLMDSGRKGGVLGDAHVSNFSEKGTNGSFINQESKHCSKNLCDGNGQNVTTKNSNDGNRTDNVSHVDLTGKELKLPDRNDGGNLSVHGHAPLSATAKDSEVGRGQNGFFGDCDIFHGRWIKDNTKPIYPPGSCPFIDRDFDCHLNKRPDDEFLRWKWKPYGCDIPSLNATEFLERLRGQKMVFVGDSLNRNMWESLVCILWQSIPDKRRVYEISGRREFKKNGSYAFKFEDYNCTVDFVSSKFLVRESSFNDTNGSFDTLRLDLMDQAAALYQDADVLIFNTGHWWTHEKTSKGENYYQEGDRVHPKLKVHEAFKRALATWARWVDQTIDANRTKVMFRGYSVTHFRRGRWNSGGQCHRETEPIVNETHLVRYPPKMKAVEHTIQEMRTPVIYLNISRLTDFRKDGHPSIYRREYKTVEERNAGVSAQDCSHWCLPGVPDTWNELLYFSLLKADQGSSTT